MFLENKGNHGVHKYFGDLVMLLIQMGSIKLLRNHTFAVQA